MTGMPAATAALIAGLQPVGVGHRDDEAVDLSATALSISCDCFAGSPSDWYVDVDAVVLAGLLGAVLDDVPERVAAVAVGDDGDLERPGLDRCRGGGLLPARPRARCTPTAAGRVASSPATTRAALQRGFGTPRLKRWTSSSPSLRFPRCLSRAGQAADDRPEAGQTRRHVPLRQVHGAALVERRVLLQHVPAVVARSCTKRTMASMSTSPSPSGTYRPCPRPRCTRRCPCGRLRPATAQHP